MPGTEILAKPITNIGGGPMTVSFLDTFNS